MLTMAQVDVAASRRVAYDPRGRDVATTLDEFYAARAGRGVSEVAESDDEDERATSTPVPAIAEVAGSRVFTTLNEDDLRVSFNEDAAMFTLEVGSCVAMLGLTAAKHLAVALGGTLDEWRVGAARHRVAG
jgi:hypothetical protein